MPKPKKEQPLERLLRDTVLAWIQENTTIPQIRAQDYEDLVARLMALLTEEDE